MKCNVASFELQSRHPTLLFDHRDMYILVTFEIAFNSSMALPIFPNSNHRPVLARISNGSVPAAAFPLSKQYKPFQGSSLVGLVF